MHLHVICNVLPLNAAIRIHTGQASRYQKHVLLAVILALVAVTVMVVSAVFAWSFWKKSQEALNSKDIKTSSEFLMEIFPTSPNIRHSRWAG
jgi:heme/copper-type cytochrome/quinol oxidase subunit 2